MDAPLKRTSPYPANKARAYQFADDGRLAEMPIDAAKHSAEDFAWLDLCGFDSAALMQLLGPYQIDTLVLGAVDETQAQSHVSAHRDAILLQLPGVGASGEPIRLSAIATRNSLITISALPVSAMDAFAEKVIRRRLPEQSVRALLPDLLHVLVDDCIHQTLTARSKVNHLEMAFDSSDKRFNIEQAGALRCEVVRYERILDDQYHTMVSL